MPKYVGLADDPNTRGHELGDPADFKISEQRFQSEREALDWRRRLEIIGYIVDPDERGWGSGYTFTR